MKTSEEIQFILSPFRKKIGYTEFYNIPKTIKNGWIGDIKNCIAYIEVLNRNGGADNIFYSLKNAGFKVTMIGLELYLHKN